jgi:2-amino-4-hydroxy-6-hydroxymethyldihydropteridine diphosphokinase
MDIAPEWRHPVLGKTVADMWRDLPEADRAAITPIG